MNEALIGSILIAIVLIVILMILVILYQNCPPGHSHGCGASGRLIKCTWSVGLHVKAPFIDRVAKRVILKEQVVDFAPQPVITKDNVTMRIDTVVFFQITDPKLFRLWCGESRSWPLRT